MDIFLIILIVIMVFIIGFILSKPFLNADNEQDPPKTSKNYQNQYQELLQDIKSIQDAYPTESLPEEIRDQLAKKKQEAAHLLRLIKE
jgi:ABC-type bacteriocin/lantibiotic exporter with double-glycine peptidase domain